VDVANRSREIIGCQPALDGSWLACDAVRKDVQSKPMQRLLMPLLDMPAKSRGAKLSAAATFAFGWPGSG
jgi:hypothetical protein